MKGVINMSEIKIVMSTNESTVVAEYTPEDRKNKSFQSEADLEHEFIDLLKAQSYEYVAIKSETDLINNLKNQLELLNDYKFTKDEWNQLFNEYLANKNHTIVDKTDLIQNQGTVNIKLDNGFTKNIKLIDKKSIHNNRLQVINQYEVTGAHDNRYDVTILVNGLPLVHVELKKRGIAIREAFNQIERYKRDSFWAGSGLYEFIQIFVISNGTHTKYYSNSTRDNHIRELSKSGSTRSKKTSNSFEFTSYWADANNRCILDLMDFTKTFFSKHSLLNILTKYCVFTSENLLLVMRPYQIVATERIINKINLANNYKWYGSVQAGGYVWHTTGSGKTLTSFKTAQLASKMENIDKVLFVVDRKDLDYQTMKEYDRFEKGCANGNTSTAILKKQLEDPNCRIIITTIQKLNSFISGNKDHKVFNNHVVMIFDECHRSQFGIFHTKITQSFKNYYLFGFTGTPIFAANAVVGKNPRLTTTEQAFGDKLHTYTIVDAIRDENVLPFRIDYINTFKEKENIRDEEVYAINQEEVMNSPQRIHDVTAYILEKFETKTKRNAQTYAFSKATNIKEMAASKYNKVDSVKQSVRLQGFNSIFAVSSIDAAKLYYMELKKQMEDLPDYKKLKVATIYSYGANEDPDGFFMGDENSDSAEELDQSSREFLEYTIKDYNEMFKTNYDTSSDKFQNYYKDVSLRMKNREIDLLIVVNMFLTGFDATTLNTLWVDKNLKYHGLVQAFSRTNRILNSVKSYGNIVCFRDLQKQTDDAISLFGDKDARGLVLLKTYEDYYYGYVDEKEKYRPGYSELVEKLREEYPTTDLIEGEKRQKAFIDLFSQILRLMNILNAFDQFAGNEILSERELQDYKSIYIDLYDIYKRKIKADKESIIEDVVFEIDLIKSVEINIDYILMLIEKYHSSNCRDKEIVASIMKAIDSTIELRSKKLLIEAFIESINVDSHVADDWLKFVEEQSEKDLLQIIKEEGLKEAETFKFMKNAFRDGFVKTTGTDLDKILPSVSLFGGRAQKKEAVLDKLTKYFDKYEGLI